MQHIASIVLGAKFWIFCELKDVGLPTSRPDAAIFWAGSLNMLSLAEEAWTENETRARLQVDKFVRERIASQAALEVPRSIHYWYWARLIAAQQFTRMLVPFDHSQTIFRLPSKLSKQEFLEWLLISWWENGGISEWIFWRQDTHDAIKNRQN
jgi:hypothetical protein